MTRLERSTGRWERLYRTTPLSLPEENKFLHLKLKVHHKTPSLASEVERAAKHVDAAIDKEACVFQTLSLLTPLLA